MSYFDFFCAKKNEKGGLKICRSKGGPNIFCLVVKMTAQNTRTQGKNGNVLACLGAEKTTKNYPKTPNQTKPPDFDIFLQISQPPGKLGRSRFFCWVRVFCAVILTTINLCFKTKNILVQGGAGQFSNPPSHGFFARKKIYGDNFMVQHNPDNHFQGVNHKFSLNLIVAPPPT